ncbi:hypothetical protein GF354_05480, partial [Candidatus Peregrinibacteria bacterium]|nr:hypothetical protein [Candidatus Peregrinibacteria bacterium]
MRNILLILWIIIIGGLIFIFYHYLQPKPIPEEELYEVTKISEEEDIMSEESEEEKAEEKHDDEREREREREE